MTSRKTLTPSRRSRLEKNRCALWGRLRHMDALHREVLAAMIDAMDFRWVGEHAGIAIAHARTVFPTAFPQLVYDIHILICDVIALISRCDRILAEHLDTALSESRDDIPADTSARQMVERGHAPRKHIRWLMVGVAGHAEAKITGGISHRRKRHDRVLLRHLRTMAQRCVDVTAVDIVHSDAVSHEERIDQPALERLCEIDPIVERVVFKRAVSRMAPHAW